MNVSKRFKDSWNDTLRQYCEEISKLEEVWDEKLEQLRDAEEQRLKDSISPKFPIGTRVEVPSRKRQGTIIGLEVIIPTWNNDYYGPSSGPGTHCKIYDVGEENRYGETMDVGYGATVPYVVYTVQPDPSPKLGLEAKPVEIREERIQTVEAPRKGTPEGP